MTAQYRPPLKGNGTPPTPRLRVMLHPRVSSDEQMEKGYSLPEQERLLRDFFGDPQFEIVGCISDDHTGRTLNRPGLNRITEMSRRGEFDILGCVKTSRLARKANLQQTYEELLAKRGQEVRYVEQTFERNKSGRLFRRFQANIDEYQWDDLREETMTKRRAKARTGKAPSGTGRYGYHQITMAEAAVIPEYAGRDGHYLVIKEEAEVVVTLFELCASGMSRYSICRWLKEHGKRTRSGRYFSPQVIGEMLRCETYCGNFIYGREEWESHDNPEVDPDTGKRGPKTTTRLRAKDEEERIEIAVPAIISRALFDAAQETLDRNARERRGRPSTRWLLTGLLYCADCRTNTGERMRWQGSGPRQPRYVCGSHQRRHSDGACCYGSISAGRLETIALAALRRIADPEFLERFAREEAERRAKTAGAPAKEAGRIRKALAANDEKQRRISDLILAGQPRHIIEEKVHQLNDERRHLLAGLEEAEKQIAWPNPDAAGLVAREAAEYLRERLDTIGIESNADRAILKELLRMFLEIEVGRGKEPVVRPRVPYLIQRTKLEGATCSRFHFQIASAPLVLPAAA